MLSRDTAACIPAGSTADGIQAIRDSFLLLGDNLQETVLGFGDKFSAPSESFINAIMGHARDFNDTYGADIFSGIVEDFDWGFLWFNSVYR